MSPKKLSEADKNEILRLYRHSPETTSTLATQYGVSSSTISRFLKSNLPEAEYEVLIQQKRSQSVATPAEVTIPLVLDKIELAPLIESHPEITSESNDNSDLPLPRQLEIEPVVSALEVDNSELKSETDAGDLEEFKAPEIPPKRVLPNLPSPTKPILVAPPLEVEAEDEDEDEDDFDEDWEDDEADEEDDEPDILNLVPRRADSSKVAENVKILPLSSASLPKVCYLVVDRSAELIARPLRDFSDLGSIPDSEIQEKTLPVFPNHRVAMRFSNRSQKVIKVPDSGILQKTSPQLQAKGITRLLVNGQVYALDEPDLDD